MKKKSILDQFLNLNQEKSGFKKCPSCNGKKGHMGPPFYANIMPKNVFIPCEDCHGTGEVFVVPNNCVVVRESNYR